VTAPSTFAFGDPRQERIYRLLGLIGPGPAAFYRDACWMMIEENLLASKTHLVSHLLREIESSIRDVLETVAEKPKGDRSHKDEIRAILAALEIPETDPVATAWLNLAGRKNDYALHSRAHRDALSGPRSLDAEFQQFWNDIQTVLDRVLQTFEERYTAWHKQLDEIAKKDAPTLEDTDFIRNHCPNNLVAMGDFFNQLKTPVWIEPLSKTGLFDHPPEPEVDLAKGGRRIWAWPQSRYLARVAEQAPEQVLKIILEIPETTNSWVHMDYVEAALHMPPELAAQLIPKMQKWILNDFASVMPIKMGTLLSDLAKGNQIDAALELARSMLALVPQPPRAIATDKEEDEFSQIFRHQEPKPKFDSWEYGEIIKNNLPPLVEKAGEQALSMLCDLLEEAVRRSRLPGDKSTANDISHSWRPAVEDHGQNSDHDTKSKLVEAVRDAAEAIARTDQTKVPTLVKMFRKRRFQIFLRLAHHLLRTFPDAAPGLLTKTLMCRGLLNKASLWHEYALMLQESFRRLSNENQSKILGWIAAGPNKEKIEKRFEAFYGKDATEDQIDSYTKEWKRDHLTLISKDLPDAQKEELEKLTAEFGKSEHPDFGRYRTGGAWGHKSPKAATDLASLDIDDLIDFLKEWEPPNDWMGASPEGLSRELASLIASDPEKFDSLADLFVGLDPTYVRGAIQGFEEALRSGSKFTWQNIFYLSQWVTDEPREIEGRVKDRRETDPDWGWTLRAISSLLIMGIESKTNPIPFDLRGELWAVLKELVEDPEPSEKFEAEYLARDTDAIELSLNTERPKAMQAVLAYAFWVRRNLLPDPKDDKPGPAWLEKMPEVQEVLEVHLDPQIDKSVGVRSIYGQRLGNLVVLDKTWVTNNLSKIFPPAPEHIELLKAVWESFVISWNPSALMFDLLRDQYVAAIRRIPKEKPKRNTHYDPSENLAVHLLLLYGWGIIGIKDPLLTEFFATAREDIRGHGFHQIGFGLSKDKYFDPDVVSRFKVLWEERISDANTAHEKRVHELWTFGWWFAGDIFDDDWALERLAAVLKLSGKVEVDHLVAKRLVKTVEKKPKLTVECLKGMVDGVKEIYEILGWDKEAKAILAAALKSDDAEAKAAVAALINRLDARGLSGFRELLDDWTH
jgi:hypothetical protein